jgi:hypothetical protein
MNTTTTTLASPGGPQPLRARNAAIVALGTVSAAGAAGAAIGGSTPTPSHTLAAPAASAPAAPRTSTSATR